ncbi:MAG: SAM-dependent methyltransferase [uncultured Acidimicrobiales bacterium]|uniref:SAM-dependent methyltransferase n=1 Tax=uncultured Acidimicrobiales bacterium TaxID=310071 RepID=A0A6J4HTD5_9ACTN|nr:MAG: SAM-dependent methyltransferase [uncultured Acidimicrobiales bacterium]
MGINETAAAGFGSAADVYERGRPSYPEGVVGLFCDQLGIGRGTTVVDLAAGTGKLTRLLVPTGATVIAVEPVEAMRAQLVALLPDVEALDGTAESIPLPDASAGAVTVAQAFHWFDPEPALAEIARVLEPDGGLGLVWNERDESVPWVAELSTLLDWGERRPYRRDRDWGAVVAASGLFTTIQHRQLSYQQELDVDTLVERALSTSYIAARPAEQNVELADAVRALADGFPARFELPYVTDVHWCHRR